MLRKGEKLSQAESVIGCYKSSDRILLWEALQAAGSGITFPGGYKLDAHDGNRRLAFVGDSIPEAVLGSQWYPLGGTKRMVVHSRAMLENCIKVRAEEWSHARQTCGVRVLWASQQDHGAQSKGLKFCSKGVDKALFA